jgi:hypothetical protein
MLNFTCFLKTHKNGPTKRNKWNNNAVAGTSLQNWVPDILKKYRPFHTEYNFISQNRAGLELQGFLAKFLLLGIG